ncbi:dynein axonemal heavy chain 6 [Papilio machaon]|uniref:dynein axonemal heavy chain 6 n=1 Tax=Papilio machaon TaxID=76193 RepID=UPI001E665A48|nr:dynein axonemal heavy chain 6 [Papilio machaon]
MNDTKRRSTITLPAIETIQRNVRQVPTIYSRKPRDIPFHLPHRKLLEKIEFVEKEPEPLTGFAAAQEDRYTRERKSAKIQLEPIKHEEGADNLKLYCSVKKKKAIKIRESRSSMDDERKEEPTADPLKLKPQVASQKEVIDHVRSNPQCGFLYMIYAVHPQNVYFTPYYLKVVKYEDLDRKNYFTISPCGVTHYTSEMVFTKLNDWEQEYTVFVQLHEITFFKVYRYWKALYVWHKSVRFRKYSRLRSVLSRQLFLLTPPLARALLTVQALCCRMLEVSLADTTRHMDTPFFYFNEAQMIRLEMVRRRITEFRSVAHEAVTAAGHEALRLRGFTVDDHEVPPPAIVRGRPVGGMSYTQKANKRKYCERLACFIKLVDYMTNYMLHGLTNRSNAHMANLLRTHASFTPSHDLLTSLDVDTVLEVVPRPVEICKWALFQVDAYVLPSGEVELNPSEKIISEYISKVTEYWDEVVRTFHNFLNDDDLQMFVQPTIMGKQVEWSAGVSPNLYFLMNQDKKMLEDITYIPTAIKEAFGVVDVFLNRMKTFMVEFKAAHEMDLNLIRDERDVNAFKLLCDKLVKQMETIEDVVSYQPLGIIFLNLCPFQELFRPQPRRLFDVVLNTTPDVGRACIDEILEGIESISADISREPETAAELVEFNSLLDGLESRVAFLEERLEYLRELYDFMGEFNIPISPEDMTDYLGLSVALGTLRTSVDARLETRGKLAGQFASQVGRDLMQLMEEVNTLHAQVAQPWLYDDSSDMAKVIEVLDDLMSKLMVCFARDKQIHEWQKIFKIPPSRLDQLDEAINDVKLRQMLWKSSKEWDDHYRSWYEAPFNTLDVDEIQTAAVNYGKQFNQMDKALPPNKIVPRCKQSIDVMKDKLPVISYLRSPALKARHWVRVEEVLHTRFVPGVPLTLADLEQLGAFQHAEELMEIAAQANSEAGLEALLKKVEETWAALEFPVLPHKDSRDVFMLGGLEEVQAALDESCVNVNTILSSRSCGPLKSRVEEWQRNLELFGKTLEEWQQCQQTWMYLEAIFSAPDIQRQLPNETRLFTIVDKSWKDNMRKVAKVPLALPAATQPKLYEELVRNNEMLDQIMKCLEAYLETKRVAFPRFFFLSNDELLEILAQTRNPHAVQPHLRKCFDAIAKLEFGVKLPESEMEVAEDGTLVEREMSPRSRDRLQAALALTARPEDLTTDIVAMLSPESERVNLGKGLKARGNVEEWLGKVEAAMFASVKRCMKYALRDYEMRPRPQWSALHPNQVVLTVSQIMWARGIHEVLSGAEGEDVTTGLAEFERRSVGDLNALAALTRQPLGALFRRVLCALITVDVHARDSVSNMVEKRVQKDTDFEWLKMIRYYWEEELDNCVARMSSAMYIYGHEYLGAGGVLVITPLTDRCYLCLMGALQLDLGGAPAGPAGTGKTETTKDLAKAVAVQCVVFNCSEGLDYKMMGRFFSGLATSGAWCCFDEFNRIDIEVLSVIAQQLITIRNAKIARLSRFMFEGREIKLVRTCAAFITMNPGYAGRTELPDNLKALFRPISMMVPDYALIAEVILYSEGFESSKVLARKMVQMYKLSSEQLSKQDHYDFGMRAVKSVLVMAGALKRANPDQVEDLTLLCALNDSNLPKFLAADALLFAGILSDLFPGLELPVRDYGVMEEAIKYCLLERNLQIEACQIRKVIQLHETMIVRWGVMLVGPTGGGKTVVLHVLGETYIRLHEQEVEGPQNKPVHMYTMNPKSLSIGELYGEVNLQTLEWHDGVLPLSLRIAVQCTATDHQWIICDGPVDAVWIENMNTVLDDNKMLCLANSERIKLTPHVHMLFEVGDLAQASPATVSRCGMVYVDPREMGVLPYARSWIAGAAAQGLLTGDHPDFLYQMFLMLPEGLDYVTDKCTVGIKQVDASKVAALCSLLGSLLAEPGERFPDKSAARSYLALCYQFCYAWAAGGNLLESFRRPFDEFIKRQFETFEEGEYLPTGMNLFEVYVDTKLRRARPWSESTPPFTYDPDRPFFETLVPTTDTARYGHLLRRWLATNRPTIFTGDTGVGKTCIILQVLNKMQTTDSFIPVTLNFSAQTSSKKTQEAIEQRLEKRPRRALGAPLGRRIVVFVDDVNMPRLDIYGAQPTIELLRQFLDFGGWHDRDKLYWKEIIDVVVVAACAPPGGGRNPLTARFVRHFAMLHVAAPDSSAMITIFKSILGGHMEDFVTEVSSLADNLVRAAVEVYGRVCAQLLPTPARAHYVFNLRDLSKCVQGALQARAAYVRVPREMLRLFYHECLRVFHDRLICVEDKTFFYRLMCDVCEKNFKEPVLELPEGELIEEPPMLLFGDFINPSLPKEMRVYRELPDMEKLMAVLKEYLDEYNASARTEMRLVVFSEMAEHVTRVARVLRAERGHALLVGPAGSGRRSVAALAAHLNDCRCMGMELKRNYDVPEFHEDLVKMYMSAGVALRETVFLCTDSQLSRDDFLEDVNNMLNTGEVNNLLEGDAYEQMQSGCGQDAAKAGVNLSDRDALYRFFINRVRAKLHLCICMSPVGEGFRRRCRMFPSLVNCCTIDWLTKWPPGALHSVARQSLAPLGDAKLINDVSTVCVSMHQDVDVMSERLFTELRRHFYSTPSSYLDLLQLYLSLLDAKRQEIISGRDRVSCGLEKLYSAYESVGAMERAVREMEPLLARKAAEGSALAARLQNERRAADLVRSALLVDEANAKMKADEVRQIADEAKADLALAMPAMEAAQDALKALNKADINELKAFQKPPTLVRFVMEPVCILLGAKPDWDSTKKLLADVNFIRNLQEYDKDHIPDATLKKIKTYLTHKDFNPDTVVKVSKVCRSMVLWVQAIDMYAKVFRVVEPKILKHKEAAGILRSVMAELRAKQKQVEAVEAQLAAMQRELEIVEEERDRLQADVQLAAARLARAGSLTQALANEQSRWENSVKEASLQLIDATGNVLVAAGCIAYFGAFPAHYRRELEHKWVAHCAELKIPASPTFDLVGTAAGPGARLAWQSQGLPRDAGSAENATLVVSAGRRPLAIDPQQQANRWIKNMERENGLHVAKPTAPNLLRILESCVRLGWPMLLEDVGEELDAALTPLLLKQTFIQGGRLLIHLGDSDIEYDPHFRLYLTTKLGNPHYLPEICIQVTLVNFTVTLSGLEEQLLAEVVSLERPELELQRTQLTQRIAADRTLLLDIEERILHLLHASTGNILDDEVLIETLNESKETSEIISARLAEAEITERSIGAARERYREVAARGALLYFAIAQLADLDPMYQFSLSYFTQIFKRVVEEPAKEGDTLEMRVAALVDSATLATQRAVSRALFARHRLALSMLLTAAVQLHSGALPHSYWHYLMHGAGAPAGGMPKKPATEAITEQTWAAVNFLHEHEPAFTGLPDDCLKRIPLNVGEYFVEIHVDKTNTSKPTVDWDKRLSPFEKLMLLKCLREEKLVFASSQYVSLTLGPAFIESPPVQLPTLYADTNSTTPLVFVLSTGSDPFGAFQKFATDKGMRDRVNFISLGQGQGPVAEKMISDAKPKGDWVFLQNCHLAASWMRNLELIVESFTSDQSPIHEEFRLYLSSMPTPKFPVSVLQNSVKVTNEPPKGLKANVKRALIEMDTDFYENHVLEQDWRTLVFGICIFHALVQERKKFGPLGWNISYEFSDSDRECAILTLQMFCAGGEIPWDALEYITSEITYGGRVTDMWDQRCLAAALRRVVSRAALSPEHSYSPCGRYACPRVPLLADAQRYVDSLPDNEPPGLFGLHDNANITYERQETTALLQTIAEVQPRSGGAGGEPPERLVWRICESTRASVPHKVDTSITHESVFAVDERGQPLSLATVLHHERKQYDTLLTLLHSSLRELQRAVQGVVVMSEALEEVFNALANGRVPAMWHARAYNSLKSLGSWLHDLALRVDFIETWWRKGRGASSWLPGLFFPQGLLTGALQTHARRNRLPIDVLAFDFHPTSVFIYQDDIYAFNKHPKEQVDVYSGLEAPDEGIIIHGLYIEAGRWDVPNACLADALPGQTWSWLPAVRVSCRVGAPPAGGRYEAPLYRTAARAGVLATTGHSTNFVIAILLPADHPSDFWILRGTALLTQLSD